MDNNLIDFIRLLTPDYNSNALYIDIDNRDIYILLKRYFKDVIRTSFEELNKLKGQFDFCVISGFERGLFEKNLGILYDKLKDNSILGIVINVSDFSYECVSILRKNRFNVDFIDKKDSLEFITAIK